MTSKMSNPKELRLITRAPSIR